MSVLFPYIVASALTAASEAAASEGHHDGVNWFVVVATIINAAIFFGFLFIKIRDPFAKYLSDRRTTMQREMEAAAEKRAAAEAQLQEFTTRLANLEREVNQVVESYEKEAASEKSKLIAETERAIERLSRETEFQLKQEVRKAEILVREAAIEATVAQATQLIHASIQDADQTRLIDDAISSIEQDAA